jgi:hypothetical protein
MKLRFDYFFVLLVMIVASLAFCFFFGGCNDETNTTKVYENIEVKKDGTFVITDGTNTVTITQYEYNEILEDGGVIL